jgi:hypothetical protein
MKVNMQLQPLYSFSFFISHSLFLISRLPFHKPFTIPADQLLFFTLLLLRNNKTT